ncbi:MAG: VCBS repeat-containing protein [Myxococcota bacterium]|nr:VCBS repeat-containing protein [Myxococcota bacterium]
MKKKAMIPLALLLLTMLPQEAHASFLKGVSVKFCKTFPWLCKDTTPTEIGTEFSFRRWTVADGVIGAAYNTVMDVDGDGLKDIVVTSFGEKLVMAGQIQVFYNKGNGALGENGWQRDNVVAWHDDYLCFPNEVAGEDIDGDGDLDLFAPSGFIPCAANPIYQGQWGLAWYEKTESGWERHEIVPYRNSNDHPFYHKVLFVDVDQDGIKDIITVEEMKNTDGDVWAETVWFKGNTSADRFEKEPRSIGQGGGGLPLIYDIDNNGLLDIFSAQYFGYLEDEALGNTPASFVWFEQISLPTANNPDGEWMKHVINNNAGPSIQIALIDNLMGDGRLGAIGANHTNIDMNPEWAPEALYAFEIPTNPRDLWSERVISDVFDSIDVKNTGAPGVIAHGDIDGDGLVDIAVSGDGDPTIYLVKQTAPGVFETHIVDDGNVGQAGISMADLNGDGILEIIASTYDGSAVYVYELRKIPSTASQEEKDRFLSSAAGRYAHYDIVAYEANMGPLLGTFKNLIVSYGFTDLEWKDGKLIATDRFCHSEQLSNQEFVSTVPDALTQAIIPDSVEMEARQDLDGSFYLWRPQTPTLLGIHYEDSANTPLPKSIKRTDPRLVDDDNDGKPGVTVFIDMFGKQEEIYIVRREIFAFEARPGVDGVLEGVVHDRSEQLIIDATNILLKIGKQEWKQHHDLSKSPISLVPVGNGYDCERLMAERDDLFPPNPPVWE